MPSHSGRPSESGTDWSQQSLLPESLKRKPIPMKELPSVEPETPEQEAESKKVQTPAIHMTLLERYEQETK